MLIVKVNVRHNLIGAMGGYRAGVEDARQFARRLRPNAFEAVALFESDWSGRRIDVDIDGGLSLMVMLDHVGTGRPSRRLSRVRGGFTGIVHLDRLALTLDGKERPIGEIADEMERQAREIVLQLTQPPTGLVSLFRPPEAWK